MPLVCACSVACAADECPGMQDTTEFTDPMASDTALRTKRKLAGTDLLFSRPKQLKT